MSKEIEVSGKNIKITTNSSEQTISSGKYDSNSKTTKVDHSINDVRESGINKTFDYKGDVQIVSDGYGEKVNSSVKIVGTPEMFEQKNYKILNNALAKFAALALQSGDDRHSTMSSVNFVPKVQTSATSSYQSKKSLDFPQLNTFSEIPKFLEKVGTWFVNCQIENVKEKTRALAQLNLERELRQIEINSKKKELELNDVVNPQFGSPATEDKVGVNYNITRQDAYESYLENVDTILAAQNKIC